MARVRENKTRAIGINWSLKYRLKIEDLEHKLDDIRLYVKQLERKIKKLTLRLSRDCRFSFSSRCAFFFSFSATQ
jgi:hypothetical protein